jgi:hypothetical protein
MSHTRHGGQKSDGVLFLFQNPSGLNGGMVKQYSVLCIRPPYTVEHKRAATLFVPEFAVVSPCALRRMRCLGWKTHYGNTEYGALVRQKIQEKPRLGGPFIRIEY